MTIIFGLFIWFCIPFMQKIALEPNTTLYPVPVVMISCGAGNEANIFSLNRITSCNAEPPMVGISVRPSRASHALIEKLGEFVVNIPWPDMEVVSDFVGSTSVREIDKWAETGLTQHPAIHVAVPLIGECPVNLECRVNRTVRLPSHSLYIADVIAIHADEKVINERHEVDYFKAKGGLAYTSGPVRERPVENFDPDNLLTAVRSWRASRATP